MIMAQLYSITGLFYEEFPGIVPWGGHFIRGMDEDGENGISGQLADMHGISRISGLMTENSLEFTKQYEGCNGEQAFDYRFTKEGDLWKGEWDSRVSSWSGRSICKTFVCMPEMDFRKVDMRTPEGFARAMLESMVDRGMLVTYDDPETGEKMVKPGPDLVLPDVKPYSEEDVKDIDDNDLPF